MVASPCGRRTFRTLCARHRRSFTPEFKAEIVDACNRGDRSVGQVARGFDLTETAVCE